MKDVEIERKWLMDGFPPLPHEDEVLVEQAYLAFGPATVRISRRRGAAGTVHLLTIKGGGTLARTEVEFEMDAGQYAALCPLAVLPGAQKRLRTYRLPGGRVLECSHVDEGEPCAFFYAEVEFESEADARSFVPPPFLGREVTEEPGHSMAAHCRRKVGAV